MASTFTTNTGIEKIGPGEQTGLWGDTTNLNFDIIDRALNGVVPITLTGTSFTLTTSSGSVSDGQAAAVVFSGSPGGPATVTVAPNTAQKTYIIRNATNQPLTVTQGSGGDVVIPPDVTRSVVCTGAGATAQVIGVGSGPTGGWQPWNDTDGLIWSFPVDGTVSAVTSPDFEDGYEYLFTFDGVQTTTPAPSNPSFNLLLFRETSNAYAGVVVISDFPIQTTQSISGWVEPLFVRRVSRMHGIRGMSVVDGSNASYNLSSTGVSTTQASVAFDGRTPVFGVGVRHTAAQKILRARFTANLASLSGSGSSGQIRMFRRGSAI
jgi:hypothetical protein